MRYLIEYAGHMPKGARYIVARVKIEPSIVDGKPVEVYDSAFPWAYHPSKKAAEEAWKALTVSADHPVYGLDDLRKLDDKDLSEWVYRKGVLTNIESHETWFSSLPEDEKTAYRVEYLNAGKSMRRLAIEKLLGVDLSVLASVVDMADSHVQDIVSGLEDGTYDKSENPDIDRKVEEVGKLQGLIAAYL